MALIINPHPAYGTTVTEEDSTTCGENCVEKYIPKHLRESPLFEKVNTLLCHYDKAWTDTEIREYLLITDEYYRSALGTGTTILNWYSLINWIEAGDYNWTDEVASGGSVEKDFYKKYSLSTQDIWLSLSSTNDEDFNEDGFKYYQHMIDPYVGTSLIQKKLLEKVRGIDGEIVDWYTTQGITNSYSFQFDEFPGWDKTKVLIIGSKLLKNAESILLSIKDENCPNRFILSHSHLDTDYLSDITSLQFEGVNICFQRYRSDELSGFVDLFKVQKRYTKAHSQLIDYYIIRKLSDNLFLDDLVENRIYGTHTPERPGRFVQLMPAWMPYNNTWTAGATWEDHYDWHSIIVENFVKIFLAKERDPLYWTTADVWGRWIGWEGDPAEWTYNKPPASRDAYYVDRNFIPGFEPSTGISLYKPLIFSKMTREYDANANASSFRQRIVPYWYDEDILSENLQLDGERLKVVYTSHTRETP